MSATACHLALGTVQFGVPYGIANKSGQVSRDDAAEILKRARAAGLDTIDTAMIYGESEQRLGSIGVGGWKVVTKLPPLPPSASSDPGGWARTALATSLDRLNVAGVHALLLHRSQDLTGGPGKSLYAALVEMKNEGRLAKIGVSIYDPAELDPIWELFPVDLVQAPFNVLDRRLASSGWLGRLHGAGVEVHTRSAFLQGLLLMDAASRSPAFSGWARLWELWDAWLGAEGLTPLEASLRFALSQPGIDRVVVGVDSPQQLTEILAACEGPAVFPPEGLASDDQDLINPSRWVKH